MVKPILKQETVEVPENVKLVVKSKNITVEGPKGTITRNFRKVPVQIMGVKDETGRVSSVVIRIWFAKNKPKSCVNTIKKHVQNMITGVTKGFRYVMKYGYKILPMQPVASEDGKSLKVINFLGSKYIRNIKALDGVTIRTNDTDNSKEIEVMGIDPNACGITCALINQSCKSKGVDKRKFLDGIYIFERNLQEA